MIPRRPATLSLAVLVLLSACTGSAGGAASPPATTSDGSASATCTTSPAPDPSKITAWGPASQNPSVFPTIINPPGTIACGPDRFMFSFLDANNLPVASPDRPASVAFYDLGVDPSTPVASSDATFIWAIEGERGVYVADVDFPRAGTWGAEFTTKAATGPEETIRMQFDVQPTSATIGVGDKAPPSETPTLDSVGGDVTKISTDAKPVERFYTTSIAQAVAAKQPFVVAFATPKFCTSAQCGPTLDKLKTVAERHPELTFINVEPYELKDVDGQLQPVLTGDPPALTPTKATNEWRLLTEPWVFVVDKDGVVHDSFMLIFDDSELESAIGAVEGG